MKTGRKRNENDVETSGKTGAFSGKLGYTEYHKKEPYAPNHKANSRKEI